MIEEIEKKLSLKINDHQLLKRAFYHTSYVNERRNQHLESNERLEFLGDAILELVTSDYLYHAYPTEPEGFLTKLRAQLVREESLAFLAKKIKFDKYLHLGRGEEASGGRQRASILADCFESFLGAIYLDQGLEVVRQFLIDILLKDHQQLLTADKQDYKTALQECLQQKGAIKIQYKILDQSGPSHDQQFTSGVYVNDQLLAQGSGRSKKISEMNAAKAAFKFVDEKGNIHASNTN